MVFSSSYFLFLFLPVALAIVLALRRWAFLPAVFLTSLVFYYWSEGPRALILVGIIAVNYAGALWLARSASRLTLPALILVNLVALFWFKYANTTRPSPRSKWGKYPTSGRRRLAHAIPASHNFAGFCKMLACQLASCAISRARH